MVLSNFSIILRRDNPELVYNIPFKSNLDNANAVFSKMAFSFNCSPFDSIYLVATSSRGNKSRILNTAHLNGLYDDSSDDVFDFSEGSHEIKFSRYVVCPQCSKRFFSPRGFFKSLTLSCPACGVEVLR